MKRPGLRWLEAGEKALQEMKVRRPRQKAEERVEWASVIKEVMTLKGLYSLGVSKYRRTYDLSPVTSIFTPSNLLKFSCQLHR